jgi:MFS family permease
MIVLVGTSMTVALPTIQHSLGFSQVTLSWVMNAYLLTFGGFLLLLGGRAGDLFGCGRVFARGLALFTFASFLCGLAGSQALLVVARALQRVGGAIIAPAALSIIITSKDPSERAQAMGLWAFVVSGGASIGGPPRRRPDADVGWRWIFLVNLPIGLAALALCRPRLDPDPKPDMRGGSDLPGALLVTASLVATVYAIVGAGNNPLAATALLLLPAAMLMVAFAAVERRTAAPLVPPGVFAS